MTRSVTLLALACLSLPPTLAGCGDATAQDQALSGMQKAAAGDFIGALTDINVAIDAQPADPNLYLVRGGIHESLGDIASTVADYEKVVALNRRAFAAGVDAAAVSVP